jgi:hypothetical protein
MWEAMTPKQQWQMFEKTIQAFNSANENAKTLQRKESQKDMQINELYASLKAYEDLVAKGRLVLKGQE